MRLLLGAAREGTASLEGAWEERRADLQLTAAGLASARGILPTAGAIRSAQEWRARPRGGRMPGSGRLAEMALPVRRLPWRTRWEI